MNCPHCNKEVFGRSHNVSDLYEEPKKLTPEQRIEKLEIALIKIREIKHYSTCKAIPIAEQALKGK